MGWCSCVSTSQQSVSQEITSLRAYLAAQSGLQWGMYETVYPPGGGLTAAPQQIDFTAAGLAGATTTVDIGAAGAGGATYDISADGDYARRLAGIRPPLFQREIPPMTAACASTPAAAAPVAPAALPRARSSRPCSSTACSSCSSPAASCCSSAWAGHVLLRGYVRPAAALAGIGGLLLGFVLSLALASVLSPAPGISFINTWWVGSVARDLFPVHTRRRKPRRTWRMLRGLLFGLAGLLALYAVAQQLCCTMRHGRPSSIATISPPSSISPCCRCWPRCWTAQSAADGAAAR